MAGEPFAPSEDMRSGAPEMGLRIWSSVFFRVYGLGGAQREGFRFLGIGWGEGVLQQP